MTAQPAYFGVTPNRHSGVTPDQKQDKRYRFQMRFWFDLAKTEERWLADYVAFLKAGRNFHETVRQGLRLMHDLRQGNTDVLLELFPFVAQRQSGMDEERLVELLAARLNATPKRPLTLPDDDDTTVSIQTVSGGGNAIETFLNAASGLQGKPKQLKGINGAQMTFSAPEEDE